MSITKAYKVVRMSSGSGRLYSYNCSLIDNEFNHELDCGSVIEYEIGEFTFPKINNSKLYVFTSLEEARAFSNDCDDWDCVIFECECVNLTTDVQYAPINVFIPSAIVSFWTSDKKSFDSCRIADFKSVAYCDALKLIRCIRN